MILAVDIGNSDMVFGFHDGDQWTHLFRHATAEYSGLKKVLSLEFATNEIRWDDIDTCILSSVVPGVTPTVERILRVELGDRLTLVGPALYKMLPVKIHNPGEIGSDLVANSFGAFARLETACIVVDFGTALTFSTLNDQGEIEGVAIAPGLKTAMKSLFMNAAQLTEVPLEWPDSAIGKGTAHALQAGILMGYVGLVRELITRIREETGRNLPVIATGGLSEVLTPLQNDFQIVDRNLTLEGLRIMAAYSTGQSD